MEQIPQLLFIMIGIAVEKKTGDIPRLFQICILPLSSGDIACLKLHNTTANQRIRPLFGDYKILCFINQIESYGACKIKSGFSHFFTLKMQWSQNGQKCIENGNINCYKYSPFNNLEIILSAKSNKKRAYE